MINNNSITNNKNFRQREMQKCCKSFVCNTLTPPSKNRANFITQYFQIKKIKINMNLKENLRSKDVLRLSLAKIKEETSKFLRFDSIVRTVKPLVVAGAMFMSANSANASPTEAERIHNMFLGMLNQLGLISDTQFENSQKLESISFTKENSRYIDLDDDDYKEVVSYLYELNEQYSNDKIVVFDVTKKIKHFDKNKNEKRNITEYFRKIYKWHINKIHRQDKKLQGREAFSYLNQSFVYLAAIQHTKNSQRVRNINDRFIEWADFDYNWITNVDYDAEYNISDNDQYVDNYRKYTEYHKRSYGRTNYLTDCLTEIYLYHQDKIIKLEGLKHSYRWAVDVTTYSKISNNTIKSFLYTAGGGINSWDNLDEIETKCNEFLEMRNTLSKGLIVKKICEWSGEEYDYELHFVRDEEHLRNKYGDEFYELYKLYYEKFFLCENIGWKCWYSYSIGGTYIGDCCCKGIRTCRTNIIKDIKVTVK